MTEDIDIWRSAYLLVQQHGDIAEMVAAQRIDEMIAAGSPEGEAAWKRILAAIRELCRTTLRGEEKAN